MTFAVEAVHQPGSRVAGALVLAVASIVAIASARSSAGGWNDGSRLATVESLVDRHTFAIDDSIFVQVPRPADPATALPYPRDDAALLQYGTRDKLFIKGHFYSDKSPLAGSQRNFATGWPWQPPVWLTSWPRGASFSSVSRCSCPCRCVCC
jgi:hypothetical protein